jgi:hypothetical protein
MSQRPHAALALASLLLALPLAALAADSDGDGVDDAQDNCSELANAAPQDCDADADGYGNRCDADFNNDGAVGVVDFGAFTMQRTGGGSGAADHDCDGDIDDDDFALFQTSYGTMKPGPSGLGCAGMAPCTP